MESSPTFETELKPPVREEVFNSGLEAMINHAVQVYFVTEQQYQSFAKLSHNKEKEKDFLEQLKSENQKRNTE